MLGDQRFGEIAKQALAASKAEQTEIVLIGKDSALTRFANFTIHQNVFESNVELRARAVVGRRVGVASSNDLSASGIADIVERALAMAERQREDPYFAGLPHRGPLARIEAFDQATAAFSPQRRAKGVRVVCELAGEAGLVASGVFCTTSGELAVANSNGLWAYDRSTKVNAMTVITGEQGAGYAERTSHSVGEIDLEALALEAVDKARRGRTPIELEPGEYPVLLEGYAVGEALSYLSYIGFGALALQEERSFMAGRLGTRIMSEQIAIWDDGLDRRGLPCAFDFEGVGKQKVALVEDGFARGVVYDTRTGARDTRPSTGHALPAPNTFGPFAWNLFMAPGRHTTEAMAREIDRGVWVTRFHYVNVVHAREAILTGMTRDGTFLIERGEVGPPIKNLRFTQNMLEALSSVRAVGSDNRAVEGFIGVNMVPALLLDRFNFTGSSTGRA